MVPGCCLRVRLLERIWLFLVLLSRMLLVMLLFTWGTAPVWCSTALHGCAMYYL